MSGMYSGVSANMAMNGEPKARISFGIASARAIPEKVEQKTCKI